MKLKTDLLNFIRTKRQVSFAQLQKRIPSFSGNQPLALGEDSNIILWSGVSAEAVKALQELLEEKLIKIERTTHLVYFIDGIVPRLPLVKRPPSCGYKSKHWLPVVLNPIR